ncbi:hypothetical protein DL96DRAFT_1709375 [Flagelloscypha sp. PMI_526]|nr:hypothetical protein DL96DRAFT_1709375 [Flagelloscypha sp. PMI_526]
MSSYNEPSLLSPSSVLSDLDHLRHFSNTPKTPTANLNIQDELQGLDDRNSDSRLAQAFELVRSKKSSSSRSLKDSKTPSLLSMALAEEERQNNHYLRGLVRAAVDRVEAEQRRAQEAESRASSMEERMNEAFNRIRQSESLRNQEAGMFEERCRTLQAEVVGMKREMSELRLAVDRAEEKRRSAEESSTKAKESAKKHQLALKDYQAREKGREEGKDLSTKMLIKEAHKSGKEEAYNEGYRAGKDAGFEDGVRSGRKQGYREGRHKGRQEEREKAMAAFRAFVDDEMDNESIDTRIQRTRDWADTIYQESEDSGGPGTSPQTHMSPQLGRRST